MNETEAGFDVTVARAHCDAVTNTEWRSDWEGVWIPDPQWPNDAEMGETVEASRPVAKFIAFFDPPTVRSMLDLIEAQQAEIERLRGASCSCPASSLFNGPSASCAVHGSALSVPPVPEEQR